MKHIRFSGFAPRFEPVRTLVRTCIRFGFFFTALRNLSFFEGGFEQIAELIVHRIRHENARLKSPYSKG